MTITEILASDPRKRTIDKITRIYHGRENCCRCGCGGKYFDRGTVGFTRAINKMKRDDFEPLPKGADMWASYGLQKSRGVEFGENYIDIPYNAGNDKCYCLYFDARVSVK